MGGGLDLKQRFRARGRFPGADAEITQAAVSSWALLCGVGRACTQSTATLGDAAFILSSPCLAPAVLISPSLPTSTNPVGMTPTAPAPIDVIPDSPEEIPNVFEDAEYLDPSVGVRVPWHEIFGPACDMGVAALIKHLKDLGLDHHGARQVLRPGSLLLLCCVLMQGCDYIWHRVGFPKS